MQPVPRSFQAHRPVLDEAWPAQPPGSPRYDPKQNFRLPLELEILTNRRCAQIQLSTDFSSTRPRKRRLQPLPSYLLPPRRVTSAKAGAFAYEDELRRLRPLSAVYGFSKRLVSIMYDLHSLERDQATAHHWLQMRKESINLFLRIDDLDNDWQIRRKPEDLRGMHMTRPPETQKTSKHCRTCQMQLSCFQNDRFVKRQMFLTIILANKNPQQYCFFGKLRRMGWCSSAARFSVRLRIEFGHNHLQNQSVYFSRLV